MDERLEVRLAGGVHYFWQIVSVVNLKFTQVRGQFLPFLSPSSNDHQQLVFVGSYRFDAFFNQ